MSTPFLTLSTPVVAIFVNVSSVECRLDDFFLFASWVDADVDGWVCVGFGVVAEFAFDLDEPIDADDDDCVSSRLCSDEDVLPLDCLVATAGDLMFFISSDAGLCKYLGRSRPNNLFQIFIIDSKYFIKKLKDFDTKRNDKFILKKNH